MEAAKWVEMIRINPGNYADSKKFAIKEYTDEQYAAELARIEEKFTPLVKLCKELGPRHAHRHQPRLAERPHHEPLRRLAARHGRERAGVRPHRAQARLPQLQVLDEVEQPEGHDRVLPVAGRAAWSRRGRTGTTRFTSASPRPAKARTAASRAPSASARCCATAWATPSASRSRKIPRAKSRSAAICSRESLAHSLSHARMPGCHGADVTNVQVPSGHSTPSPIRPAPTAATGVARRRQMRRRATGARGRHSRSLGQGRAEDFAPKRM